MARSRDSSSPISPTEGPVTVMPKGWEQYVRRVSYSACLAFGGVVREGALRSMVDSGDAELASSQFNDGHLDGKKGIFVLENELIQNMKAAICTKPLP